MTARLEPKRVKGKASCRPIQDELNDNPYGNTWAYRDIHAYPGILLDSDVEIVNVDGAQIVCIHVPQADWMAKPIYLNGNVYKGTYRRNNEGDYHCTEAQVKAMIRDSNADGNDSILIEYYGRDCRLILLV